jgi:hypothetical protein
VLGIVIFLCHANINRHYNLKATLEQSFLNGAG